MLSYHTGSVFFVVCVCVFSFVCLSVREGWGGDKILRDRFEGNTKHQHTRHTHTRAHKLLFTHVHTAQCPRSQVTRQAWAVTGLASSLISLTHDASTHCRLHFESPNKICHQKTAKRKKKDEEMNGVCAIAKMVTL